MHLICPSFCVNLHKYVCFTGFIEDSVLGDSKVDTIPQETEVCIE